MKTLKSIVIFFCIYMSFGLVSAQQAYFDWEHNMDLLIGYNAESDSIEAIAVIPSETNQNDQFSLGIYVDGREYRKFFKYDSNKNLLYVEFIIPQDLDESTSIYLSVKDAQYNEVFTTIPANFSFTEHSRNENTSVTSIFPSSAGQKDYGVFSMQVSTSTKSPITTHTPSTSSTTSKRQNISDLTRAELINRVQTGDYTQEELPEIIEIFQEYKQQDAEQANQSTTEETTIIKKQSYTPKYSSQSAEPATINGIGNSNSHSSWRAQ